MEDFVIKNFQTTIIQKAKATMAEFNEDPDSMTSMLYNICTHLEACYIISDMNFLDEKGDPFVAIEGQGKEASLRPQYEVIEGLPRQIAWMIQRSLAQEHGIEVPKYLADIFDYKKKRFIEVGITKGIAEDYFLTKQRKLEGTMDIMIFSYSQHYSMTDENSLDEEGKGRVLSRLTELQAELSQRNLWAVLQGEEEVEKGVQFDLGVTMNELREISIPTGFGDFTGFRAYIENHDPKGAIERTLSKMSPRVSTTAKRVEWSDIRPIAPHILSTELEEVPYNAILLLADEFGLTTRSTGESKRPRKLARDCLEGYSGVKNLTEPILLCKPDSANEVFLWKLWRDCVNNLTNEEKEIGDVNKSTHAKWATGDGLTYQKISKELALDDQGMEQEVPKIPERKRIAAWVQAEMNILSQLTNKKSLDLPELGPSLAPIEHVGNERRQYFIEETDRCKATNVMMKYILFHTSLLNESNASMSSYKIVPITNRTSNPQGEAFDHLLGIAVKGQSHLRGDTDVVSVVTYEFSLTDPRANEGKWKKYTVFKLGKIYMGDKEKNLFLYCRVNGTNKIKMKWGMEARRCILQAMQQMEAIVDQESSIAGYDMTRACFKGDRLNKAKEYRVGTMEGKVVKGSFGKVMRITLTKCFMHYVFGDAQLEGFSAESRRLLLIVQALKDRKNPWAFDLEGLYEGIEECVSNNPWVIQSAQWLNEWISLEKEKAVSDNETMVIDS